MSDDTLRREEDARADALENRARWMDSLVGLLAAIAAVPVSALVVACLSQLVWGDGDWEPAFAGLELGILLGPFTAIVTCVAVVVLRRRRRRRRRNTEPGSRRRGP